MWQFIFRTPPLVSEKLNMLKGKALAAEHRGLTLLGNLSLVSIIQFQFYSRHIYIYIYVYIHICETAYCAYCAHMCLNVPHFILLFLSRRPCCLRCLQDLGRSCQSRQSMLHHSPNAFMCFTCFIILKRVHVFYLPNSFQGGDSSGAVQQAYAVRKSYYSALWCAFRRLENRLQPVLCVMQIYD